MKILLFTLLTLLFIQPLYAFELVKDDNLVKSIKGDFNRDGIEEKVTIKKGKCEKGIPYYHYDLEIKSNGKTFLVEDVILSNDYSCGLEKIIVSSKANPFIGISYASGMHGWRLTLYIFDGKEIKEAYEVFSDCPSIEVKDVDNDGENEIVTTCRDYWHNPIEHHFISTYKYDGKKWNHISKYETRTKKFIPLEELGE